jgi:hypothetical protein
MSALKIIISPKTKIGELLDNFPDLESVLMEMSPAFEKLKNPILRKTVARVATLQQVAAVGGLNVDDIVNRLREEVSQGAGEEDSVETRYISEFPPEWFDTKKITSTLNATPIINSGGSPMSKILHQTNILKPGEIFEIRTPFIPAPIIDMLKAKGFNVYCVQGESETKSYVLR